MNERSAHASAVSCPNEEDLHKLLPSRSTHTLLTQSFLPEYTFLCMRVHSMHTAMIQVLYTL